MSDIEIKKKLITLVLSQLIENKLLSINEPVYKEIKKELLEKKTNWEDIKEMYDNILQKSLYNTNFTKNTTREKMLSIIEDINHFKQEYFLKDTNQKVVYDKLKNILIYPLS